jgi:hypothetical protein
MKNPNASKNLRAAVDRLGALNAQMSALREKADQIKLALVASGEATISGRLYKAVVVPAGERSTLDGQKVRAALTPAQLAACTVVVPTAPSVRVYDL